MLVRCLLFADNESRRGGVILESLESTSTPVFEVARFHDPHPAPCRWIRVWRLSDVRAMARPFRPRRSTAAAGGGRAARAERAELFGLSRSSQTGFHRRGVGGVVEATEMRNFKDPVSYTHLTLPTNREV